MRRFLHNSAEMHHIYIWGLRLRVPQQQPLQQRYSIVIQIVTKKVRHDATACQLSHHVATRSFESFCLLTQVFSMALPRDRLVAFDIRSSRSLRCIPLMLLMLICNSTHAAQPLPPLLPPAFSAEFVEFTAPETAPPPYDNGQPSAPFLGSRGDRACPQPPPPRLYL